MVDEAGPKVVAGEGEMDGWAHGTARDAAQKCWTVADLWEGNGRWSVIRSERKGPLRPQVKEGNSRVLKKNSGLRAPSAEILMNSLHVYFKS